ncbi:hypothetical protein [Bifidobacterium dentium]|uniref:hypothetical protein n=1 Tax=Bifidobacterium dentium TaxID=1689 RepID=UPI0018B026AF|nr:hypothetical protein [Bifidobacterium dentium]MBF9668757.1 hypothetical protein [Bifidobacterium dentium]
MGSTLVKWAETVQGYSKLIGLKRPTARAAQLLSHMALVCLDPACGGRPPMHPLAYNSEPERRYTYYETTADGRPAQLFTESRGTLKDALNFTEKQTGAAMSQLLRDGFIEPADKPHNGRRATYRLRIAEMYYAITTIRDTAQQLTDASTTQTNLPHHGATRP